MGLRSRRVLAMDARADVSQSVTSSRHLRGLRKFFKKYKKSKNFKRKKTMPAKKVVKFVVQYPGLARQSQYGWTR